MEPNSVNQKFYRYFTDRIALITSYMCVHVHVCAYESCMCICSVASHTVQQCLSGRFAYELYIYCVYTMVYSVCAWFRVMVALKPNVFHSCRFLLACTQWTSQNILYCAQQLKN